MTPDEDDEASDSPGGPTPPELPAYVLEPLQRQSPERLETVAEYARALAAHRRVTSSRETSPRDGDEDEDSAGREDDDSTGEDTQPGSVRADARVPDSRTGSGTRVSSEELESLAERGVSTDPGDYESVPADGAYVTIKETKPGYRYYYWQWREGDTWKNRYIGPVQGGE